MTSLVMKMLFAAPGIRTMEKTTEPKSILLNLRGFAKKTKFQKSEFTMEVGEWSHPEFFFFSKSSQNSSKPVLVFWSSIPCVFCLPLYYRNSLRGFAKLNKFQKSKINLDSAHPTHPPSKLFSFWKLITDMDRTLKS